MLALLLFASMVLPGELTEAAEPEGLTLCLSDARGASTSVVSYGTNDDDEAFLRELLVGVSVSRLERSTMPLRVTAAVDHGGKAADRVGGVLLYDRDVIRREDGGLYGYMISAYSVAPGTYQCVVLRPERTCFASPRGLPVVSRCEPSN